MENPIEPSIDDVKNEWEKVEWEKFEVSKEEYDKLKEIESNKTIALKQEREANKKAMWRLSELEAKEKELQEKDMKKKGKYEELLKEKQSLIDELTEKANKFDEFQTNRKKETEIKLVDLMGKVPKEILEENMDILEDLSDEKKIKFLWRLVNTYKKDTFNPELNWWEKNSNNKADIDIEESKKWWFDSFLTAMLKKNIQ